jgi:hypothetical protein
MSTNKNTDFDVTLKTLDLISESFKVDVWIPSKKEYVSFKEISGKQQKELISSAIDSGVYNTEFVKTFYKLIKENSGNDDYTVIDKLSIALTLREKISPEVSISFDDETNVKVQLKPILEKFEKYSPPKEETISVSNDSLTVSVVVKIPTIKDELSYEEEIHKISKKTENVKTQEDIQKIISDAFISETTKYISKILVNDDVIDFSTLTSFNQKIKVVEKLPSVLVQKILEKISDWKKETDQFLTVKSEEGVEKVIPTDSVLFVI